MAGLYAVVAGVVIFATIIAWWNKPEEEEPQHTSASANSTQRQIRTPVSATVPSNPVHVSRQQPTWSTQPIQTRRVVQPASTQTPKLTPYQGKGRRYGYFDCRCGRYWSSAYTFANSAQRCQSCEKWVYPYRQDELDIPDHETDLTVHHDSARCQRCITTGRVCSERGLDYYN